MVYNHRRSGYHVVIDVYEVKIPMVALSSHWICYRSCMDHGSNMVYHFYSVVNQDCSVTIWRLEIIPKASPIVSRAYFGAIYLQRNMDHN